MNGFFLKNLNNVQINFNFQNLIFKAHIEDSEFITNVIRRLAEAPSNKVFKSDFVDGKRQFVY